MDSSYRTIFLVRSRHMQSFGKLVYNTSKKYDRFSTKVFHASETSLAASRYIQSVCVLIYVRTHPQCLYCSILPLTPHHIMASCGVKIGERFTGEKRAVQEVQESGQDSGPGA